MSKMNVMQQLGRWLAIVGVAAWFSLGAAQSPSTLVIGFQYDVDSLDAARLGPIETDIGYKIYSSLARIEHGTVDQFVPDLAESWSVSEDGMVYTFHLRQGVQWHRGYGELTAEDVRFSFERLKEPELASPHLPEALAIDHVAVVDPYTVEIHLTAPWPDFMTQFIAYRPGFIVNEQALTDHADNYSANAIGTGSYVLERLSTRDEVVLVRNEDYYGAAPFFDTIRYAIVLDESILAVALERGEVDLFYATDPLVASQLLATPGIVTQEITSQRVHFAYLNVEKAPTDDPLVRQALWWAIDREEIAEAGFFGLAEATDTVLNPFIPERLDERAYTYDPDRARQLLEEAGYDFSQVLEIPMDAGDFITPIIQAQLARIGVQTVTPAVERLTHIDVVTAGDFHIALRALLRATADGYISRFFASENIPYPNASRYADEEMDRLIREARSTVDDAQRAAMYHEIQRKVHADAPVIPLVSPVWVLASRPDIEGAIPGLLRIPEDVIRRASPGN